MASLEEISGYPLDEEQREELFAAQRVCTLCWTTSDGWPVGVTHRYIWHDGKIWVATSSQRLRVRALEKRPQSCVIIDGVGTEMGPDRTMTIKTTCEIRRDRETLLWFFGALSKTLHPDSEEQQQGMAAMMDTPRRVILELTPVKYITYDGGKLAEAIVREGVTT